MGRGRLTKKSGAEGKEWLGEKFDDRQEGRSTRIFRYTKESIIGQTYFHKISPDPSFPNPAKRGTPFRKGREGGIWCSVSI